MKKSFYPVLKAVLVLLSVMATIKICFLNLNIDEEYAVAMAYRMVSGDQMFLDIWAPTRHPAFLRQRSFGYINSSWAMWLV